MVNKSLIMKIDLYTQVRNEEKLMPYFLRHYSTFVDRIFIIDDKSTDKTVEIAKRNPKVKILRPNYSEGFDEIVRNTYFEDVYKKYSRGNADWVIYVDGDEFVYHKNILKVLEEQKNVGRKLLKMTGYAMVSEKFPTTFGQIYEECNRGTRSRRYDKIIVFNPDIGIVFTDGRHSLPFSGSVRAYRCGLVLLHYKYLSREFIMKRWDCGMRCYSKEQVKLNIKKDISNQKLLIRNAIKVV